MPEFDRTRVKKEWGDMKPVNFWGIGFGTLLVLKRFESPEIFTFSPVFYRTTLVSHNNFSHIKEKVEHKGWLMWATLSGSNIKVI